VYWENNIKLEIMEFIIKLQNSGGFILEKVRDALKLKWPELKGKIRTHWGKITEDDLQELTGKTNDLITVLRKRYGYGKVQAEIEIDKWLSQRE
jgi:uncharacterized protein YjbJ (UPF0337 family)